MSELVEYFGLREKSSGAIHERVPIAFWAFDV